MDFKHQPTGFVIYNEDDGTFSSGGIPWRDCSIFTKTPKIWKTLGHVKNHLNLHIGTDYVFSRTEGFKVTEIKISVSDNYLHKNANIYEITDGNKLIMSIHDYFKEKVEKLRVKAEQRNKDKGILISVVY